MASFLLTNKGVQFKVDIGEKILHIHSMILKTTPSREALIIHTNQSLMLFTPDDGILHPANHIELKILHIFSSKGTFTCITPNGQYQFSVVKKETLFSITNTKGCLFPYLLDTKKFAATIYSACGQQQIFLLHENGNLTTLKPRPITYVLNLPQGEIKANKNVVVIRGNEDTHFIRFNENLIVNHKILAKCSSIAIGKLYIFCGRSECIEVFSALNEFSKIGEIDLRQFGVMGDFTPVDIKIARNGSLIVNYQNLGITIFDGYWNCIGKLFNERKLEHGIISVGRGSLWAYESNIFTRWEVKESLNCDDMMGLKVVFGKEIGIITSNGIEYYKYSNAFDSAIENGFERISFYKYGKDIIILALRDNNLYIHQLSKNNVNDTINIIQLEIPSERIAISWTFSQEKIVIFQQLVNDHISLHISVVSYPEFEHLYENTITIYDRHELTSKQSPVSSPLTYMIQDYIIPDKLFSPTFDDFPSGNSKLLIQSNEDYYFVIISTTSPRLIVFKKIDGEGIFDISMLFSLKICNEDIDIVTAEHFPISFCLHYNQNGKILTPHHLVIQWDSGLLTSTIYNIDDFSQIERCEIISNKVQNYLSYNNIIISYPPLMLHSSHSLSMNTLPSTAIVLFQTYKLPKLMDSPFTLTDEILCIDQGNIVPIPCASHLTLLHLLEGRKEEMSADTLRELLIFSLDIFDKKEITKAEFKNLHNMFKEHFMYPILIVRVSRIIDNSLWPKLFSVTPSPIELFENVLKSGYQNEAAAFIRVIDVMMGREKALLSTLQLLENVNVNLINDIVHSIYHGRTLENASDIEKKISSSIQNYITSKLAYELKEGNMDEVFSIIGDSHPFIIMCLEGVQNKNVKLLQLHHSCYQLVKNHSVQECFNFGSLLLENQFYKHTILIGMHSQIKKLLVFPQSDELFDDVTNQLEPFDVEFCALMKKLKPAIY
ncbi:hypothetical protein ENUP19_0274G0004 [Entamoeba nuttalli]|uniref:RIC1 C-terminal alpha solenoid region domain-containing protein n=2 Tax=Entamoeba nuttalli TaxID=412467 RepID=K2G9G7_ENTNP|nr:hypothetical protein ENU1_142190 [Entamoeba nuttalli P19]EKE39091.1 hypothetical protein ENU1_142190 [Entamoeba nuttalli P19]|eukprot:XP_008858586.1 hypothetical protein ENU1_142190 [Entamoeba nuttalli P19]